LNRSSERYGDSTRTYGSGAPVERRFSTFRVICCTIASDASPCDHDWVAALNTVPPLGFV
jgi:hypothetical protein